MAKTFPIRIAFLAGACAAAALASPAAAGTTSSNLSVSASVNASCTVSTTALDFGGVDTLSASPVDGTGGVSVTCTNGTDWTAAADAGSGSGASFATRLMSAGGNTLSYTLYTNAGRTTVWGDGSGSTATIGNTGSGSAQNVTVYGRIPAGQTSVPAGAYSDTVSVTITY